MAGAQSSGLAVKSSGGVAVGEMLDKVRSAGLRPLEAGNGWRADAKTLISRQ